MNITYNLNKTVLTRTDKNIITYNIDEPINATITYDDSWELPLKAKINYDIYEEIIDIEDDKFVLPKKIASVFGFNITILDKNHQSISLVESIGNPPKSKLYSEDDIITIVSNNPLDNLEVDGKLIINSTSSLVTKDGSTFAADAPYIEITVDDPDNIRGTLTSEQLEIIKKDNAYIKLNFGSGNGIAIVPKVIESIENNTTVYTFNTMVGTNILFFQVDEHGTYIGIQMDMSPEDFIEGVKVNGNILTLDDGKKAVLNLKTINGEDIVGEGNIEITSPVTDVQVGGKSVLDGTVAKVDLSSKQDKLVSGTNIRTINGTSLLASGNIQIDSGPTTYLKSATYTNKVLTIKDQADTAIAVTIPDIPTVDYPVTDVKVNGTTVVTNKVANITVKNPEIVTLTATAEATQGTITAAQLTTLQAYDFNIIEFNNEVYTLMDKGHSEGYLTYSHVGIENSTIFIKTITITISTLAWVLNTRIVPEMEYDESTKTLNIVG